MLSKYSAEKLQCVFFLKRDNMREKNGACEQFVLG